jgi:hypothetical protein
MEENILLEGLRTEENPQNIRNLLWTVLVYICENITPDSNFPNVFVNLLLSQITAADAWPQEVVLATLNVFGEMAKIYPSFRKDKGKEAASLIIRTLCNMISQESANSQTKYSYPEDLISACFTTLLEWIMVDQGVVKVIQLFGVELLIIDRIKNW